MIISELILKLAELVRLVTIHEKNCHHRHAFLRKIGWEWYDDFEDWLHVSSGESAQEGGMHTEKVWNHGITQEAFKSEVLKVVKGLTDIDKHYDPTSYPLVFNNNLLKLSFDELLKRILKGGAGEDIHTSQLLMAICYKLGLNLKGTTK